MDDDSIGGGHVDAGFDNGGAQQHVVALLVEALHDFFEFAFRHLPVRDGDARFGHQFFQPGAPVLDGVDFVVQEIHLSAALEFAQQGFAYCAVVFAPHEGLDGQPFLRRGGDNREIAYAFQRHAQRAGYGRGGKGQHIDFGAQGFQGFFLAHAEAVLFVDDDQAQAS